MNGPTHESAPSGTITRGYHAIAAEWLEDFAAALERSDTEAAADMIKEDAWWRDNLALTWDIRTLHGREEIRAMLQERLAEVSFHGFELLDTPQPRLVEGGGREWIEAFYVFETKIARGRGVLRLTEDEGGRWKAWTVLTAMSELIGFEPGETGWDEMLSEKYYVPEPGRKRWRELRHEETEFEQEDPVVLIVGAGHSGLGLAARLDRLGVSNLVIDRFSRLGDNWRNRYESLHLHDPFHASHFPYLRFPEPNGWPLMLPKDKLAAWLESYGPSLDLNVWTETRVLGGSYNEVSKQWSVAVERGDETMRTLRPRHLVLATGNSTIPFVPDFHGMDDFLGEIVHSSAFTDGRRYAGRKVAVVGTGNSGHDIAQDLYEQGAEVTLVQRSSTYVMSTRHGAVAFNQIFAPGGPGIDDVDLLGASIPDPLKIEQSAEQAAATAELDRDLLEGLEQAGFRLNDKGILAGALMDAGGYYIDQGCSQLIIDGSVALKHGAVEGFTPNHVVFADGSTLEADAVVLATGFQNMRESARELFGDDVSERCTPVWGIDEERRELRSVWRDSGHPRLWFHAGSLQMSRYYSGLLALQIKAIEEGLYEQPSVLAAGAALPG